MTAGRSTIGYRIRCRSVDPILDLRITRYAASASLPLKVSPCLPAEIDDLLAILDLAGQNHFGQRILHRLLDHAFERTGAVGGIPALVGEPLTRRRLELDA